MQVPLRVRQDRISRLPYPGFIVMQIGIDSYCFHRYFGEIYAGLQTDPGTRWRMEGEFLDFALASRHNLP